MKEVAAEQAKMKALHDEKVKAGIWRMDAGITTQVRVCAHGEEIYLVVGPDGPVDDPVALIKAAVDFFTYYDLGKTRLLKHASLNDKPNTKRGNTDGHRRPYHKTSVTETSQPIGVQNNTSIYEGRVRELYQYVLETFTHADVVKYFTSVYSDLRPTTLENRARVYEKYLETNNIIKRVGSGPYNKPTYQFVEPPFGEEPRKPPAVAEFDPDYARDAKMRDLDMYRRT